MRIEGLEIRDFAKPEYTQEGPLEVSNIDGDLLIKGPNQSGKTLTFNAIHYVILGETIDLRAGHGNHVEVDFQDGSTFQRREVERRYHKKSGDELTADEAGGALIDRLGMPDAIKRQFIHSHIDRLPLEVLSPSRLIDLILTVSDTALKEELEEKEDSLDDLEETIQQVNDEIDSLKRERDRRSRQVQELQSQRKRWEKVLDLIQDNRLSEISETLKEQPGVEKELTELNKERRGIRQEIAENRNELNLVADYENDFEDIVAEAMKEFICPVCDERVGSENAAQRLNDGNCPFCDKERSLDGLEQYIDERRQDNSGRSDELENQIDDLQKRIEEIDSRIKELEQDQSDIADLNETAVNKLDEYNHNIAEIQSEAVAELDELESTLDEYQSKLTALENEIEEATAKRDQLEDQVNELRSNISSLKDDQASKKIDDFAQRWNSHYRSGVPELALEFDLTDQGRIRLPDSEDGVRYYNRRGDLSDAEVMLLNITFAVSLNEIIQDSGVSDWDILVFDEPFARLDEGNKHDTIEYLNGLEQQVMITSSEASVWEEFDQSQTLELTRNDFQQAKLTDEW